MSKNGIGWSVNLGICRLGINPYGRYYVSMGLPGTGFYFVKYIDFLRNQESDAAPQDHSSGHLPYDKSPGKVLTPNQAILDVIKKRQDERNINNTAKCEGIGEK